MITQDQCRRIEALGVGREDHYLHKFTVNPTAWAAEAAKLAERYTAKGQEVLDLGSGIPYFAHESEAEVISLDVDATIALEAAKILDQPYTVYRLVVYQELPRVLAGFDVITMFGVNLRLGADACDGEHWGCLPYEYLAERIRGRLNPGGRWLLRPNQSAELSHLFDYEWWIGVTRGAADVTINKPEAIIQWPDP